MVKLKCLECGKPFESVRRSTKHCSPTCGKRAWRRNKDRDKYRGQDRGSSGEQPVSARVPRISDATAAALEAAGRTETPLGQLALRLALRIDVGGDESGSAIAAMSKELRATLGAALAGAAADGGDVVDMLRAKREAKQRGA